MLTVCGSSGWELTAPAATAGSGGPAAHTHGSSSSTGPTRSRGTSGSTGTPHPTHHHHHPPAPLPPSPKPLTSPQPQEAVLDPFHPPPPPSCAPLPTASPQPPLPPHPQEALLERRKLPLHRLVEHPVCVELHKLGAVLSGDGDAGATRLEFLQVGWGGGSSGVTGMLAPPGLSSCGRGGVGAGRGEEG